MSIIIRDKGERDRIAFFSRNNNKIDSSTSATVSIMIIVLMLLAGGFVAFSPTTPMTIITTVLAQEAGANNASTTDNTTTTIPSDITITATTNTTNSVTTAAPSPSTTIHLSEQPIWQESTINTGVTPFNQTHSIVTFFGNGTLTVPDTGETITVNNNGTAFVSSMTGSGFGRESVFSSKDGDSTTITFHEIMKNAPATSQTKGITMAVFDSNATLALHHLMV